MSARSIRRAAERQSRKLGIVDVLRPSTGALNSSAAAEIASEPPSEARLAANRENAQKSSGPKTPEGKAASSLNAVKTALTGRTVLLPSDDAVEYERHILAYEKELRPFGQQERDLAHSIADSVWRLRRIRSLEQAFFSKGRVEFAEMFPEAEPAIRVALIELHTFESYEKKLRNLALQEARLARRRDKEIVELRLLQEERKKSRQEDLKAAATLYQAAKRDSAAFNPAELGFVFSIDDIEAFLNTANKGDAIAPGANGLPNHAAAASSRQL
jgi:hypothetical protein